MTADPSPPASDQPVGTSAASFFDNQRAARKASVTLVFLFSLAVIGTIGFVAATTALALTYRGASFSGTVPVVTAVAALTLVTIAVGTISKTLSLRAGGVVVATSCGAVRIDPTGSDPQHRRLRNLTEEMSLAAGLPVPHLFVLPNEPGINAFAAGFTPADAAITVTSGCLTHLSRDELQGVLAHEFSHILNGDMRLNIKLIGLLNGLLMVGLIGLRILRYSVRGSGRNGAPIAVLALVLTGLGLVGVFFANIIKAALSREGIAEASTVRLTQEVILLLALSMAAFGFIGMFFANIIKAAVSRQREWLADAAAVQFTRQTSGLAGALKKIAGLPSQSRLRDADRATELSHMLFGDGRRSLHSLWATHPPLLDRIRSLDPTFSPLDDDDAPARCHVPIAEAEHRTITPALVSKHAGTLTDADLRRGALLRAELPPETARLAAQPTTAAAVIVAILVAEPGTDPYARQIASVRRWLGPMTARLCAALVGPMSALPANLLLPLVDLALPQIAAGPPDVRQSVLMAVDEIAAADRSASMLDFLLARLVRSHLQDAATPNGGGRVGHKTLDHVQPAVSALLAALSGATGNDWRQTLDHGWAGLDGLAPEAKSALVEEMAAAVLGDGTVTVDEAETLRVACRLIHVPVPALFG